MADRNYGGGRQYSRPREGAADPFDDPARYRLPGIQPEHNIRNTKVLPSLRSVLGSAPGATAGPSISLPEQDQAQPMTPIEARDSNYVESSNPDANLRCESLVDNQGLTDMQESEVDVDGLHEVQTSLNQSTSTPERSKSGKRWKAPEDIALFKMLLEPPYQNRRSTKWLKERLAGEGYHRTLNAIQVRVKNHLRQPLNDNWTLEQYTTWRTESGDERAIG